MAGGITGADITGGGKGTSTITITATQNQINATLANATGLTYRGALNYNGGDALHIVTTDDSQAPRRLWRTSMTSPSPWRPSTMLRP